MDMSDVIKYTLSAAIELCEQLDNDVTNYHLKMLEYKRERDEARIDAQKSKAYKRVLKETNLRQTERIRYLEGATNHACGTPLSVALRERDEAREAFVIATDQIVIAQGKVREANKERDEAVEEIKEWKTLCLWGGTTEHIHGFIRGQQSRIQHLECERDEAMELLASEKITRNHIITRSVEVEQERDEAREEVKRLKVILDLIKKDTI